MDDKSYLGEFTSMEKAERGNTLACINDADIKCAQCYSDQQVKHYKGLRIVHRRGCDLKYKEDLLNALSRATELCGLGNKPELRRRIEEYLHLHYAYDCKAALENIKEFREEAFSSMPKQKEKSYSE
jgi:hypothetical protein